MPERTLIPTLASEKLFLPQGTRRYTPLRQATAQQVMIDIISKGPTNVLLIGAHTNFSIFLMSNPHLKKNVQHIYVMGGSLGVSNSNCCTKNKSSICKLCKLEPCRDPGTANRSSPATLQIPGQSSCTRCTPPCPAC
ncbi:hypothetical protein Droror1_Dr00015907 [Drosera rotundifolia]